MARMLEGLKQATPSRKAQEWMSSEPIGAARFRDKGTLGTRGEETKEKKRGHEWSGDTVPSKVYGRAYLRYFNSQPLHARRDLSGGRTCGGQTGIRRYP